VFRRDASGWREEGRLKPLPGADHDSFGQSVALSGDLAFVASRDNELVPNNAGVIDWYLLDGSGWTHAGRLLGSEPASGAYLGWALDIEGRTVVASSWGVDGQAGAYFFSLDCDRQRNYCPSTLNSSGTPAVMSSTGSQHIGANDFTLVAEGCPANTSAIFVYAEDPRRQALGDGFLCLDPARSGVIDLSPVLRTDNGGHVERLLDFPGLPVAGEILAGTTWYFQCLFRDPSAGGTGLNLTDGLEVNFCP
jgi:hypothetical protein